MKRTATAIASAVLLVACAPSPDVPRAAAASTERVYVNPVLNQDFPDPAVLRAPDGYYYAYATQGESEAGDGRTRNVQVARSPDLVRWEALPDALPAKPAWASRTQDFWAPHVHHDAAARRYLLYYSAKPDAALADPQRGLCLAVAVATRPEGPFADKGAPLECGPGFENIDPMAYDDPATGRRLLYWGSGFGPIKVRELAPDRLSFAPGSQAVALVHPDKTDDPDNYMRLIEGAWLHRRATAAEGVWYYLFLSGDNCCGPKAHYAALVARSRSATGPFEVRRTPVLAANAAWNAPGHNSAIEDARGDLWLLYHAVDRARPRSKPDAEVNTRRVMLLDRAEWVDGWPVVRGGPSKTERQKAVVSR